MACAAALLFACLPEAEQAQEPPPPIDYAEIESRLEPRAARGKTSDVFPNIRMTDQHGREYLFFDDLIKDRAVVVNFMFTDCALICPGTTSHLARLHAAFAGAVGRDLTFLSVTLDPENDSEEALRAYWEAFGSQEGWLYLRGNYEETELLRRRMGVYDLDPIIDADKTQHGGIVTFGSDATDRWAALPALSSLRDLQNTIIRFALVGRRPRRPLAAADQSPSSAPGERVHAGRGVIRELSPGRGEVVLEHEAIVDLMPAMTMAFRISDAVSLQGFSAGQRVKFGLANAETGFEIVRMELVRPDTAQSASAEGAAGEGRQDYVLYCASCHGEFGDGDGPLAASLDPRPARHSDAEYMTGLSDEYLLRVIEQGGAAVGKSPLMAAWGGTLSEAQIENLVAFIRTLAQQSPAPAE
jgi:protein SCO1/2